VFSDAPPGTYLGSAQCDAYLGGTCYLLYSQGPRPPGELQ